MGSATTSLLQRSFGLVAAAIIGMAHRRHRLVAALQLGAVGWQLKGQPRLAAPIRLHSNFTPVG